MGYLIYQLAGWLVFTLASPFFLFYFCAFPKNRDEVRQRLGFLKQPRNLHGKPLKIWLHASSVGEIQAARVLITEIKTQLPDAAIILSTGHRRGYAMAKEQLDNDILCFYAPLDLAGVTGRAVAALRPDIYACLETELWPNILRTAHRSGAQLVLLNGRMSNRSFRRYKKIAALIGDVVSRFDALAVITAEDGERYANLGVDEEKITVLGNAKYDLSSCHFSPSMADEYRDRLSIRAGQPVWVAGSTHTGEEEILLEVYKKLKQKMPELIWIVAPRHPRRIAEIETLLAENGIGFDHLSRTRHHGRRHDVLLVDTMGDLAGLYSIAGYAFCGGSLVKRGGHNIFEAAIWGAPVFYGPSMEDFADARELLEAGGGGFTVQNADDLFDRIARLAEDPGLYEETARKAKQTALAQQGSAAGQAAILTRLALQRQDFRGQQRH